MKEMRKVILVCVAIFPLLLCSGIVYSILSIYIISLGATKSQIGFLYTAGAIAGALTSPLSGKLADRWGRKVILLGAMAIFCGVFFGFAIVREFRHLFPIMLAEGMAWGGLGSSATALIADLVPQEKRGAAVGIYNTSWNLGWIIGPTTGGLLSDHLGFRPTFLICSLILTVGVIMGVVLLPKEGRGNV